MVNPLDIYARATRRLPLTPGERALLKTADQLLLSALAGGGVAIFEALMQGHGQLTFGALAQVGLFAAASALITGVVKLFRARGDALGSAAAGALEQVQQRIPPLAAPPRMGYNQFAGGSQVTQVGPLGRRVAPDALPPLMPDSAARRRQLLTQAGIPPTSASAPGVDAPPDAQTRPSVAVAPTWPVAAPQPATQAPQQPLPPVASVAPPEDDADKDDDGPPTVQVPVVRPAPVTTAPLPPDPPEPPHIAPPPPVPPSEWLVKP